MKYSDILIKNMEMPERCGQCFLRVGNCKQRIYMEQRPKNCPLVEIPTPHGRLIDADELKRHIDKLPALPDGNFAGTHRNLKALINMQKTVIEAEGSET